MDTNIIDEKYRSIVEKGLQKLVIRQYQREFLSDNSRRRIVLKSRQIGFSFICALDGVVEALLLGKNQLFASASERQSKIMLDYAKMFLDKIFGIDPVKANDEKIILSNGAELLALPKNWRTIQGFNGSIYLDEFAWNMDDVLIWRALIPSASEVRGRITVLSTPFAKRGKFYDLWNGNENYSHHKIDIYDALAQGKPLGGFESIDEFVQDLKNDLDEPDFFPAAYECQFIDDQDSYIPLSLIEPLMQQNPEDNYREPLWLGVDIGRKQDITDITAVGVNPQGKRQVIFNLALKKTPYHTQKKIILQLFRKYNIAMCYMDRTGIGDNIFEDVKRKYPQKVRGLWFGSKNKEKMAINLKRHIENQQIYLLRDRACALHYTAIKRVPIASGFRYQTEKKGRRKEYGHADKFWSLALALLPFDHRKRKIKIKRRAI